MILLAFLLTAIPLIYYYLVKPLNYWKQYNVKQTKPLVMFGDIFFNAIGRQCLSDLVADIYNLYDHVRYIGFYQMRKPILLIKDPELIKQIAIKDFDHFVDHPAFMDPDMDPLWGKNLFALTGDKWRHMRATLSPSFTSSKMKFMFTLMSETAECFADYFLKQNVNAIEVELKDVFTRFTNDVIASTAFGVKVDSVTKKDNEFYMMGKEVTDPSFWKNAKFFIYILFPKLSKIFNIRLFNAKVAYFFRTLIKDTIKVREEQQIIRPDLIHILKEARKGNNSPHHNEDEDSAGFATVIESEIGNCKKDSFNLSDDDITAQALIFFFAGLDSVSGTMCFTFYELAINKGIQDRLRDEIRVTYKECGNQMTYEGLIKMKYMDLVVSEALRKWPITAATDRECTKPYTIQPSNPNELPINLKNKDVIWLPIYGLHRDPKYYPNPDKFDPERFNDDNKNKIVPYTYLPFGTGPRGCIGSRFALLEVKALLFHMILHFKIVPTAKSEIPVTMHPTTIGLSAKNGFWFNLERLNH